MLLVRPTTGTRYTIPGAVSAMGITNVSKVKNYYEIRMIQGWRIEKEDRKGYAAAGPGCRRRFDLYTREDKPVARRNGYPPLDTEMLDERSS
jgi:hypothetical protein